MQRAFSTKNKLKVIDGSMEVTALHDLNRN